jgi:ferredoxin-thioredoxin reductase catalytic chain
MVRECRPAALHSIQECHCMLFLTDDNDFAGKEQNITMDELRDGIKSMM